MSVYLDSFLMHLYTVDFSIENKIKMGRVSYLIGEISSNFGSEGIHCDTRAPKYKVRRNLVFFDVALFIPDSVNNPVRVNRGNAGTVLVKGVE
jgi:hypothetical protein